MVGKVGDLFQPFKARKKIEKYKLGSVLRGNIFVRWHTQANNSV